MAGLKRGKFSIEGEAQPRRPVSVPTHVNFDAVHSIVSSDRRIGLKQIPEALNVLFECVYYIAHVDLDIQKVDAYFRSVLGLNKMQTS